mmetsp:Transcript_42296/g.59207  ORF Transcript_42296/g.59207 Transcript_42296/m.59207 type:complete len:80 (+) Transcript_42296:2570-2809(+)
MFFAPSQSNLAACMNEKKEEEEFEKKVEEEPEGDPKAEPTPPKKRKPYRPRGRMRNFFKHQCMTLISGICILSAQSWEV